MIEVLKQRLSEHASILGYDPLEIEQGSYDWFKMKLGVVSASNCSKIFGKGLTRKAYMNELVGEICTGMPQEEVSAKTLQWGNDNEPQARELYTALGFGGAVQQIPFVYGEGMRAGCSPDGIDGSSGLEIKCPFTTKVHIDFLRDGTIKKEYHDQMQFSMWVSGAEQWNFASFDPRMMRKNIEVVTVSRSEKRIAEIAQAHADFIGEMDQVLDVVGFKFGDQWKVVGDIELINQQKPQGDIGEF